MNFKITDFQSIHSASSLKGKFAIEIVPGVMKLGDFTYHEKSDGKRWCSFPARQYLQNGKKKYIDYITFSDKSDREKFKGWLLAEVDKLKP